MAGRISGITIILYDKEQTGVDEFKRPIYTETAVEVENVLVGEPSSQDVIDTKNLTGKVLAYTLAIPKGDAHTWTNRTVEFWGERFHHWRTDTGYREHDSSVVEPKGQGRALWLIFDLN